MAFDSPKKSASAAASTTSGRMICRMAERAGVSGVRGGLAVSMPLMPLHARCGDNFVSRFYPARDLAWITSRSVLTQRWTVRGATP